MNDIFQTRTQCQTTFRLNGNSITARATDSPKFLKSDGANLCILPFVCKDTTEIAVPRNNPTFSAIPGDVVYAYVLNNASVVIDTYNTHAGIKFKLGVALTPYEHRAGERDEGFMILTLSPDTNVVGVCLLCVCI